MPIEKMVMEKTFKNIISSFYTFSLLSICYDLILTTLILLFNGLFLSFFRSFYLSIYLLFLYRNLYLFLHLFLYFFFYSHSYSFSFSFFSSIYTFSSFSLYQRVLGSPRIRPFPTFDKVSCLLRVIIYRYNNYSIISQLVSWSVS